MKKYKLLKWYPSLPKEWKEGQIVENQTDLYRTGIPGDLRSVSCDEVELNKEFWENVPKCEYVILSFKGKVSKDIYNYINGCYKRNALNDSYSLDYCLEHNFSIHSVRRIYDDVIFTVGDFITGYTYKDHREILGFEIFEEGLNIIQEQGKTVIEDAVLQKKVLFTTHDNVNIFKGDSYWLVNTSTYVIDYDIGRDSKNISCYPNFRYFSSEEKAREYVIMNNPLLSINDITGLLKHFTHGLSLNMTINRLRTLIKTRMNNELYNNKE